MNIRTRWIEFLYKIATGTKRTRTLLTPLGAIFFGLFTSIFVVAAIAFDEWLGLPKILESPACYYISSPILLTGSFFTGWSVIHFLKVNGTPVPVNPPPSLVTTGPYAYTRNPMVTGICLLLAGIGVLLGSISLTFIFTPIFLLVNKWELEAIEEPELVKRLGEEYITYRKETPMFFPNMNKKIKNDLVNDTSKEL
jgi:protein-S-isoprenylcysteine O-methyltransferase Ste14